MRQGCGDWLYVAVQAFNDSIAINEWAAVIRWAKRSVPTILRHYRREGGHVAGAPLPPYVLADYT